ncbi:hypothetical protein IJG90_03990 [Candidatus Saccharibacteria bacterium]|nr:hypothetical protein [Candidatus Saccharibacteria bacterium]
MKKRFDNWPLVAGILLFVVAGVLIIWFFLHGETTVTGGFPEPESSESISCEVTGKVNDIFNIDDTSKVTTRVTATFLESKLSSISLVYSLYYNDSTAIGASESKNHAAINLATQSEGLGSDIFNLHFNKLTDRLEIRLYTEADNINNKNSKYLMMNGLSDDGAYTKTLIEKIYESQGFKCVAKD